MKLAYDLYRTLVDADALSPALRARVPPQLTWPKNLLFFADDSEAAKTPPASPHEELTLERAGAVVEALGAEVTVLLLGPPGIGKSALADQIARRRAMQLSVLQCPQLAPEDVLGLPFLDGASTEARRRVRFAPPERIVPRDDRPVLLLVDELAAAAREVQRALHELLLDRRVGEHALPAGSIVMAASNRVEDGAFAMALSTAVINRIVVLRLRPDHAEWMAFAERAGVRLEILAFLRLRPEALLRPASEEPNQPLSTPRSWTTLSRSLDLLERAGGVSALLRRSLAAGSVSPQDAAEFCACAEEGMSAPRDPAWLVENPTAIPREGALRWTSLYAVRDAVARGALGPRAASTFSRFFKAFSADERSVLLEGLTDQWARIGALRAMTAIFAEMIR